MLICFFILCKQEVQICTLVWPSTAGEILWDVTYAIVVFLIPGLVIVISYSRILQVLFYFVKQLGEVNSHSLGINISSSYTNTLKEYRHY